MSQEILKLVETSSMKKQAPVFQVGDIVKVKVLIKEGNKERNQSFEGMVIAFRGPSINRSFTVRRVFQGVAIERTFLLHSPKLVEVKVTRKGKTRRAKLYYMRSRIGTKATRLKEDSSRIAKDFQQKLVMQEQVADLNASLVAEEQNSEVTAA